MANEPAENLEFASKYFVRAKSALRNSQKLQNTTRCVHASLRYAYIRIFRIFSYFNFSYVIL